MIFEYELVWQEARHITGLFKEQKIQSHKPKKLLIEYTLIMKWFVIQHYIKGVRVPILHLHKKLVHSLND